MPPHYSPTFYGFLEHPHLIPQNCFAIFWPSKTLHFVVEKKVWNRHMNTRKKGASLVQSALFFASQKKDVKIALQ